MKKLYAAANLQEAQLILDLLAEHSIDAQILNTFAQGGLGELPFTHTYPEIWIDDEADMKRAHSIVHNYEARPDVTGVVTCPACGEKNPENFETCWSCRVTLS